MRLLYPKAHSEKFKDILKPFMQLQKKEEKIALKCYKSGRIC